MDKDYISQIGEKYAILNKKNYDFQKLDSVKRIFIV